MDPVAKRKWPRSGIETTLMGFGAAPIGNIFRPISEEESAALIKAAWDAGVRYFDTAPMYGHGLSEARCGRGLRWYPRDEFVLSTKVGRLLKSRKRSEIDFTPWVDGLPFEMRFDYSYDGAMRSIEDSLQRLGLEHIDIALIHDIDGYTHGERQPEMFDAAMSGAAKALLKLRDEKVVKAVGVGVNEWQVAHEAIRRNDFDCLLLAGRYTLLEQDALDGFLPMCEARQISVILGGGYNSGILATGAVPGAKYNYAPAPEPVLERVSKIEQVCRDFSVPLKSAALQFVLGHPAIPTNIPGVRNVAQLDENLRTFSADIPTAFWDELKRRELIRQDAPTPGQ
ncbi:aldo/keto reductase [Paraburkholderia sp. JPY432]|uniref:aldo/keto reductase n=1 Tax=Paraburkholderia youngii TaxID=2782701 RepID=UPI0015951696|nr:aldo/keto reductase [Paraburkholderia youngii]NVH74107.1 aldo/keto reductase [Paraburkholderia youngii]